MLDRLGLPCLSSKPQFELHLPKVHMVLMQPIHGTTVLSKNITRPLIPSLNEGKGEEGDDREGNYLLLKMSCIHVLGYDNHVFMSSNGLSFHSEKCFQGEQKLIFPKPNEQPNFSLFRQKALLSS